MKLTTPITKEKLADLKAGDAIEITGTIYTARDAAHKRMNEMLERAEALPFDIKDAVIYYVGPTPAAPNHVFGSAGPTTSMRMDAYAPRLYDLGLSVSIAKATAPKRLWTRSNAITLPIWLPSAVPEHFCHNV